VKVEVKNGAYADPQSGLDKTAHVYQADGNLYTAVLSKVDDGINNYYKIQVLESNLLDNQ
jgi:hypothetical protein